MTLTVNALRRVVADFGRRSLPRYALPIVAISFLTGCNGGDVTMQNPHTGATVVCPGRYRELNPWSQTMACVANYEAQGWTRAGAE
jgi:hypothetical protein